MLGFVLELGNHLVLVEFVGPLGDVETFIDQLQHVIAFLLGERFAHAARHDPGRMHLLAAQHLDDRLADLPESNAFAGQLRMPEHHAEDVAFGRVAIPTQQQIGRRQVEKRQRVGLRHLGQVHDPPQFHGHFGNPHAQQRIARLGGRQQMAHRADPAGAGRQRRHFPVRPPFAEFLETPELGQVELGILDLARIVQLERDARMTFDPRDRFDRNRLTHGW